MFRKVLIASASILALGGSAFAADLPTTKGPAVYTPPPPVFTWTGLYVGGQVGYQWGRDYGAAFTTAGAVVGTEAYSATGVTGGVHIGYNLQVFGPYVVGLEGDANALSYNGVTYVGGGIGLIDRTYEKVDGSIRGRVGYAWDRALFYATGGVAFGSFHDPNSFGDALNRSSTGWTVGGGVEYAIDNNWSVRAEYRHTDLPTYYGVDPRLSAASGGLIATVDDHQIENKVQVGFSYKFDWAQPIVSKY